LLLILAARRSHASDGAKLLLAAAFLALAAFPFPVRSGPDAIRFLTPLYVPLLVVVVWAAVLSGRERRAGGAGPGLAAAPLRVAGVDRGGRRGLSPGWPARARAEPPFLLPNLDPVRDYLLKRGIRRVYASYGPAWRLTFESGETIVASQPWNERFRHYPLPLLDEVRFAKNVAWVLIPKIPTDLPAPRAFEASLAAIGGPGLRTEAGTPTSYSDVVAPFGP